METDILKEWKDLMTNLKWQHGLIGYPILSNSSLQTMCDFLNGFFPKNYFKVKSSELNKNKKTEKNWLYTILTSNKLSSVFQIAEITRLLGYYDSLKEKETFPLLKNNGELNNGAFRDVLFELFVNKLLQDNGLNIQHNKSYTNAEGNNKPLDGYFEYNGKGYIIECTKLHNAKLQNLKRLAWQIEEGFLRIGKKYEFVEDQLFNGYIGFIGSTGDAKLINKAKDSFDILLKKYLDGVKLGRELITIPKDINNPDYEISIQPGYLRKYDLLKGGVKAKFRSFITFRLYHLSHNSKLIKARFELAADHPGLIEFTKDKLRRKFRQHKSSGLNKIVVVEIENTEFENLHALSLPLGPDDFKSEKIAGLVGGNNGLIIILKDLSRSHISYKIGFIRGRFFDQELAKKLEALKIEKFIA